VEASSLCRTDTVFRESSAERRYQRKGNDGYVVNYGQCYQEF